VQESVMSQVSLGYSHMIESYGIISHNRYGKIVHRPYSSCISSVENLIKTCYESPKKEINSHIFEYLIHNIKSYNSVKI